MHASLILCAFVCTQQVVHTAWDASYLRLVKISILSCAEIGHAGQRQPEILPSTSNLAVHQQP